MGSGLQRIAKLHGGLVAKDSKTAVIHRWDEKKGKAVIEATMSRDEHDRLHASSGKPLGSRR